MNSLISSMITLRSHSIQPCGDDPSKVMATFNYSNELKIDWASIKNNSNIFNDVKCSKKLGIARFLLNKKTILLYKSGRGTIRLADDSEDLQKCIETVSQFLVPKSKKR